MTGRLEGKVALVTGSARGMGQVEAELFAAEGASVVVSDILDDLGEETAARIGTDYRHLDVTSEQEWEAMADFVETTYGRLDILINNAGTVNPTLARFDETPIDDHRRLFAVNVEGPLFGMRAMLPLLEKGKGASIVNISSLDGLAGVAYLASYVASKHALLGLSRAVALELGPLGIRVNTIHPGMINTPLVRSRGEGSVERLKETTRHQPIQRMAEPIEVANMALFLASDEASYCTGSEFRVDGGHLTGPYRDRPAVR